MPTSSLDLTGLASYELFLRGTLDKIGAYPDALHVGDYKTASNTFTEHTYTPAHREMAESLNTDLYEQLVRGLADGRHKSRGGDPRRSSITVRTCRKTPSAPGSIDDVAYEDELDDKVAARRSGHASHFLEQSRLPQRDAASLGLNRGQRIAVIYAVGMISSGESSYDSPAGRSSAPTRIVEYLRKARGRQLDQGDRAADRQPGRIGDRVGRDLARGAC